MTLKGQYLFLSDNGPEFSLNNKRLVIKYGLFIQNLKTTKFSIFPCAKVVGKGVKEYVNLVV